MLPSSELKLSRRDVTNACVRMMVDFLSRYLRIRPMLLAAAIANWHVFLTCDLIVICVSIIAPRFLISGDGDICDSPTVTVMDGTGYFTNFE